MTQKEKFVVDTSAFMTEGAREDDDSMAETVEKLLERFERASEKGHEFYMPSSTFEELEEILDGSVDEETLDKLRARVRKQDPPRYDVKVSGELLHDFIDEMRKRVDKGLRLSEKAVRELDDVEDPDQEHYEKEDVVISDVRDDYKEALRKGIVDSREDLDLLLLAKELDAALVSEDRGVLNWAGDFGVRQIKGSDFPDVLDELVR